MLGLAITASMIRWLMTGLVMLAGDEMATKVVRVGSSTVKGIILQKQQPRETVHQEYKTTGAVLFSHRQGESRNLGEEMSEGYDTGDGAATAGWMAGEGGAGVDDGGGGGRLAGEGGDGWLWCWLVREVVVVLVVVAVVVVMVVVEAPNGGRKWWKMVEEKERVGE
ncbi:hypothetical protein Pmani_022190 [Petrolisthes manimaculis]|uniref:Uncharacterized protein n=1 Tax=Petrolisthes manimaculis TaxID=1843537 RepID=A0AAE1PEN0_9EUCA|nr:hypothetical protein Pmani_022190 [Petrolisthes manimaculis]